MGGELFREELTTPKLIPILRGLYGRRALPGRAHHPPLIWLPPILSRTLLLSTLKVPIKALGWRALPGRAHHPPPPVRKENLIMLMATMTCPIRSSCIPHVYPRNLDPRVQVPHVLGWRALLGRAHHPRVQDRDAKAESNSCHGGKWEFT